MGSITKSERRYFWESFTDEELLDLRFCDLGLRLEDSPLLPFLERLSGELSRRSLEFEPRFWLSTEWFTPDGVPGIAVPFYLVHPRLRALDRRQMQGILQETSEQTRKILRHEAGHALENAFRLRERKDVEAVFGPSSKRYPKYYSPQPYSRKYVRHLGHGYAQSHPDEDFAETFGVWLTPRAQWRKKYAGLPALEKLEFMDGLMKEIAGKAPLLVNRRRVEPLSSLKMTLRTHYRRSRKHFLLEAPHLDGPLRKVFREKQASPRSMTAQAFLRKIKGQLSVQAAELSGEPMHRVERVVKDLILRSRNLSLRAKPQAFQSRFGVPVVLTRHTVRLLKAGMHRIAV
jgi:hypothetical protein